jgi:hypothetical protein
MAEGIQAGPTVYWLCEMRGTLSQDVAKAETRMNDLDVSTRRADGALQGFHGITRKNSEEISKMGIGLAATGGAVFLAGQLAGNAGEEFKGLSNVLSTASVGMMAVAGITQTVTPIMRAAAIVIHGSVVASVVDFIKVAPVHVAATNIMNTATLDLAATEGALAAAGYAVSPSLIAAARSMEGAAVSGAAMAETNLFAASSMEIVALAGYNINPSMIAAAEGMTVATGATLGLASAMRVLLAASVIGAVVTGAYLVYEAFNAQSRAAKELDNQIKTLRDDTDALKYVQQIFSDKLQDSNKKANDLKTAMDKYDDAIKNVNRDLERSKDIQNDLTNNSLDLEQALLSQKDAQQELQDAREIGEQDDVTRADLKLRQINQRVKELKEQGTDLTSEQASLMTSEDAVKFEKDKATAGAEYNKVLLDRALLLGQEANAQKRLQTMDLTVKLLEWQKEGYAPPAETLSAMQKVPWMAEALGNISPTVSNPFDIVKAAGHAMTPVFGPGAFAAYAVQTSQYPTSPNPLFRNAGSGGNTYIFQVPDADTARTLARKIAEDNNDQANALLGGG